MTKIKKFLHSKKLVTIVWVVGIIVIWEIFAFIVQATKRTPINVLPHIWQIIGSFFSDSKVSGQLTMAELIGQSCAETLLRAGLGFLIGTVVGYVLALLMNLSGVVEKIAFPYLMLIQMIPILGMAPIILAITGDINTSRIVIAAILTFYPVSTNVLAGFKAVEREKHELMYSYAANKFQLYTKTLIPSCIPYFFTGLKISAPMAITASILVDTLQGGNGLGCMLSQSLKGWAYACEHTEEAAEIVFAAGSSVSAAHQSYMAGEVAKLVTTDMNGNSVSAANVGNMDETAMQQTLDLAKKYIILEDSAAKEKLASMKLDDIRSTAYLTYDKEKDGAPEKTSVSVQLKWLPQAQFMGYYVAKAKGYYDEVGLDVNIVSGGGDISETTAVYNGTVDFGVTWVSNLINANAGGMELLEVAQVYQRSGLVLVYKNDKFTK